jgi:hypothetical protein
LARHTLALEAEAADLESELELLVCELAPALLAEPGIGVISAAQLLNARSHQGRFRSEAAFASLAGAAPIPASSGEVVEATANSTAHSTPSSSRGSPTTPRRNATPPDAPPKARHHARSNAASSATSPAGSSAYSRRPSTAALVRSDLHVDREPAPSAPALDRHRSTRAIALGIRACLAGQRVAFATATEWVACLDDACDEVVAAMIDRLVDHAEILSLKGNSYHLRDRDLGGRPPAREPQTA